MSVGPIAARRAHRRCPRFAETRQERCERVAVAREPRPTKYCRRAEFFALPVPSGQQIAELPKNSYTDVPPPTNYQYE